MRYIKILAVFLLPIFLISWLWSQDLNEAAKKEKERREAVKSKKIVVITNADLQTIKKKAAVGGDSSEQKTDTESGQPEGAAAANPQGTGQAADEAESAGAGEQEALPTNEALPTKLDDSQKLQLESNYAKAKEYADLLETKINGLWQTFYAQDDMTPKDQIQQEISDTFDKYQKARMDEAAAKDALDNYLSTIK